MSDTKSILNTIAIMCLSFAIVITGSTISSLKTRIKALEQEIATLKGEK